MPKGDPFAKFAEPRAELECRQQDRSGRLKMGNPGCETSNSSNRSINCTGCAQFGTIAEERARRERTGRRCDGIPPSWCTASRYDWLLSAHARPRALFPLIDQMFAISKAAGPMSKLRSGQRVGEGTHGLVSLRGTNGAGRIRQVARHQRDQASPALANKKARRMVRERRVRR